MGCEEHSRGARGRQAGEDGAVAVIVAIMLVVFVGMAAVAIDLGSGWSSKRDLVADLDAAALAGAQMIHTIGTTGCQTDPQPVIDEVAGVAGLNGVTVDEGDIDVDCDARTVEVRGSKEAISVFASAMGSDGVTAGGFSQATADTFQGGLMPIALCQGDPAIELFRDYLNGELSEQEYLAYRDEDDEFFPTSATDDPPGAYYGGATPRAATLVHRLHMDKVWKNANECPDPDKGPGNWGWLNFGEKGGANKLRDLIREGYDGPVEVGDNATCGDADDGGLCEAETGNMMQVVTSELRSSWQCQESTAECDTVAFIVYSSKSDQGANTTYQISGLLEAVVWDAQDAKGSSGWIDVEPVDFLTDGVPENLAGQLNIRVCGADPAGDSNTC
jgi:hypothetical protein